MAQAKKSSARKSSAKKTATKKKSSARTSTAKKKSSAKKTPAKKKTAAKSQQDFSGKSVAELRKALTERLVEPLNLVMLSRDRIEETVEEAVARGSMTRDAAQDLVSGLVERGRRQTSDVLSDLEQLLGRGRPSRRADVAARARRQVGDATARARDAGDTVLVQADRARRAAGVGPTFPVIGYDDLTAAQIQKRLDTLTPAELRKVRDYERRNVNRKSVLDAVDAKLA
ncbi:MAG TPA: hypothetical protein VD790_08595 [Thermoleophilaceae bacterium]|nr:hypothetical protein [Thermoleophilaceae bacterium]